MQLAQRAPARPAARPRPWLALPLLSRVACRAQRRELLLGAPGALVRGKPKVGLGTCCLKGPASEEQACGQEIRHR